MIYADTNFYTNLLMELSHSSEAELLTRSNVSILPVTWLLRLEVVNAIQQCVFMRRHGVQDLRLAPEHATVLESHFLSEVDSGIRYRRYPVDESSVEHLFMELSHRHTAKEGFRTYDILHVSSALVLGCDMFWSFDAKAKKLAKLEGLKVN
ncbi:MAG: type II toxin-antitoxin system VapC family toxin [Verrucomicrobiaceae bacterium]|nr:type II toxin-antitoxin system VapC family toxin [Verrucomicrobiaceae bacterium]